MGSTGAVLLDMDSTEIAVYAQEQSVDNGHFESTWIIRCCRSFNDNDKGDSVAAELRFCKVHGADR